MQENPDLIGIKTGIKKFDEISGGIQKGELGILMAQTGKGKSCALGNFGTNAWLQGKNIVLFSLEMTNAVGCLGDSQHKGIEIDKDVVMKLQLPVSACTIRTRSSRYAGFFLSRRLESIMVKIVRNNQCVLV